MGVGLKVYADRTSQPSLAVLLFCKLNGIEFEEIRIDIYSKTSNTPLNIKVPAIVDARFKLFESHAILIYICCAFPGVASHWYPGDLIKRAKIHSVLDWHHSNLRRGTVGLVSKGIVGPLNGWPSNPQAAKEGERILLKSLSTLESFWLKDGRFLIGSAQQSIADTSLVCEIMQLEATI